jgi:hypothetical protein
MVWTCFKKEQRGFKHETKRKSSESTIKTRGYDLLPEVEMLKEEEQQGVS